MARRKRTIGIIAGAMPINLYMKGVILILRRRCWPLGPAPDRRPIHYRNGVGRLAGGSGRNAARYGCPRPPPRRRARPSSSRVADGRVAPATTLGLRHRPALLTEISVFDVTGPASLPNTFILVRRKTSPKSGRPSRCRAMLRQDRPCWHTSTHAATFQKLHHLASAVRPSCRRHTRMMLTRPYE
jgi:hypothetical protein